MGPWKFWEWVAYGCIWIAAIVSALDTALKLAPTLSAQLPGWLVSEYWSFMPLALLVVSGVILLTEAIRARIPPFIPVLRPVIGAAAPGAAPTLEYGDLDSLVERCWNDYAPNTALARDTQALNVANAMKEDLKVRLRRQQFSRFAGSASYVDRSLVEYRRR